MEQAFGLIKHQAFGDLAFEVEEEKALVEMTKLIMRKMDIVQYSSLRLIESVANLLVLFKNEPKERVALLTKEDFEAILDTIPAAKSRLHHETEQEEDSMDVSIERFAKLIALHETRTFKMGTDGSTTEASIKDNLSSLEKNVLRYINQEIAQIMPDFQLNGPVRTNEDIAKAATALSDKTHSFESKDKGVYVVTEQEAVRDKAGVNDDVSLVLIKLAESQAAAYAAGGRPFQEALFSIKDACIRKDTEENHHQSLEYLQENVRMEFDPELVASLGWESESASMEREYVDEQAAHLAEQKQKVVSVHKRDLDEILGLVRKHNQDKFMRALDRIREEREADQADVEKIIGDQFKVLETKSDELKNKYTSLFSKAKLSVIEQYESSREQMYKSEDRKEKDAATAAAAAAAVAAISSAGASIDHHSSLPASSPDEQQQESSESVLIPWRVAVERDLSQFNADIVHEFEADNTSLFSEAAKDIARESKDKIDKYLKF